MYSIVETKLVTPILSRVWSQEWDQVRIQWIVNSESVPFLCALSVSARGSAFFLFTQRRTERGEKLCLFLFLCVISVSARGSPYFFTRRGAESAEKNSDCSSFSACSASLRARSYRAEHAEAAENQKSALSALDCRTQPALSEPRP